MWDLSSPTRDQTCIPFIGRWVLTHWATRKVPEWFFKNWESSIDIYTLPCVRQIASGNLLYRAGSSAWCSGRGLQREGAYVYLWMTHIARWQKLIQYCKQLSSAGSQREESRPWQRSWGRKPDKKQRRDLPSGVPPEFSWTSTPKNQSRPDFIVLCFPLFCL